MDSYLLAYVYLFGVCVCLFVLFLSFAFIHVILITIAVMIIFVVVVFTIIALIINAFYAVWFACFIHPFSLCLFSAVFVAILFCFGAAEYSI